MAISALYKVFVPGYVRRRTGWKSTYYSLHAKGIPGTQAEVRKTYTFYRDLRKKWDTMKFVPITRKPTSKFFMDSDEPMSRRYKFGVRVELKDKRTGLFRTEMRYIKADRNLTRRTLERRGIEQTSAGERAGYYEVVGYRLAEAWHRSGDLW